MKRVALSIGVVIAGLLSLIIIAGASMPQTVDVAAAVSIDAPRAAIWRAVSDFEDAFENSNPEHDGTYVLSEPKTPLRDGLRFRQQEYVGGIRATLDASLFDVYPGERFAWRAQAVYRVWGLSLVTIEEGGVLRIEQTRQSTGWRVSHRVWGNFPDTVYGRVLSWVSVALLEMEADAERHTRVELEFFKRRLETDRDG